MADDNDAPNRGAAAWGQALAALVLVPALGIGLWAWGEAASRAGGGSGGGGEPKAAGCAGAEPEEESAGLSGTQLCEALNRPDLADLLGTPGERAKSAGGSGGGSSEDPTPSGRVEFETYTVTLAATSGSLRVAGAASLLGDTASPRTVLGRPAAFYSDRTIQIRFRLDGSDSSSGPGVPARVLTVARDAQDSGGFFEVTLWRADGAVPDDAVVLRVAETILPTVPGWTASA